MTTRYWRALASLFAVTMLFSGAAASRHAPPTPATARRPPPSGSHALPDELGFHRAPTPASARALGVPPIPLHLRRAWARTRRTAPAPQTYTMAALNQLNYADLVTTLAGIQAAQITDLFQDDPAGVAFYQDAARVQALIDAIKARGATFTPADSQGIPTLVEVLRAGFYLAYHDTALAALNQRSAWDKCLPAIRAAQANANFKLGATAQNDVINAMGSLIGNADSAPDVINAFVPILHDFNTNWAAYATESHTDASKARAVWQVASGIDYDLTWNVLGGMTYSSQLAGPFDGAIDGYVEELVQLAATHPYDNPDIDWVIDAAVYLAGYDGRFDSKHDRGLQCATMVIGKYGASPWIFPSGQAAEVIHDLYNDTDGNGLTRMWTDVQNQIKQQYTPLMHDFDGGLFHTQVSPKLDPVKLKTLIWAHKETRAQFFRALGIDTPVDPGHHQDDALTMVIYGSPDDYRMNRFAYGLSTDNGGITIETLGTFFTYERTMADSIYSLEELFRHEGIHYLQGRYEEPGFFGDSPLYDNDRLTWIDEGSAEFFAGSTRTQGVEPRHIKAELIAGYDPSTWYDITQVVNAKYASGFTFYDYAGELVDFFYHDRWDDYLSLLDRLHANDGPGFSDLCTQDAADATLEKGYHMWLQYVAANASTFPSPLTSPDYLAAIPARPLAQVVADISGATGITGVTTSTTKGQDWNTFTLRGAYAAGASQGSRLADWRAMNTQADAWLTTLGNNGWSGYKTLTCYFVSYAKDASGKVSWQVVFHGVDTDDGTTGGGDGGVVATDGGVGIDAGVGGGGGDGGVTLDGGTVHDGGVGRHDGGAGGGGHGHPGGCSCDVGAGGGGASGWVAIGLALLFLVRARRRARAAAAVAEEGGHDLR